MQMLIGASGISCLAANETASAKIMVRSFHSQIFHQIQKYEKFWTKIKKPDVFANESPKYD